ncbi:hypothetical protein KQX54_017907 [Cotesia glomerata]|uniref:Uncharacterized protein n=1 Tax=Cotesia glomerata TaxID=32391 RepID=A0AAV7IT94_COTGL|nr:hypothetical protein KQX54_017907 [Cotesia glomerata]
MGKHKKRSHSEERSEETKKLRREMKDLKELVMRVLATQPIHDAVIMADNENNNNSLRDDASTDLSGQSEIEGSKKVEEPGSSATLDEDIIKILGKAPETGEACQKIHADVASMDKLTHDLKVQPQKKSLTSSSGNWNGSSVPRRPTIVTSQKFKPQIPKSAAQKLPARLSSQSRSNQTPSQSYRRRHLSNSSSTSRSRTH